MLAIRKSLVGPKRVVPPAAGDPFPFFVVRNGVGDALLHLLGRFHAAQFNRQCIRPRTSQVHVRVIESRHYKVLVQVNGFRALLASATIEQHVGHLPDTHNFPISDSHRFGPGFRRIIGINPAMRIKDGMLRSFLSVDVCMEYSAAQRRSAYCETGQTSAPANRSRFHRAFSSATPEIPRTVNNARFRPASRPVALYHSCKECAPPPIPPAPMEMASMPIESGMFASVEERSKRD